MRFTSVCPETPRPASLFSRYVTAWTILLLAASCAFAGDPASVKERPKNTSTEASDNTASSKIDQKELTKYDVARIGQRGIGHGFNLYSVRREHDLGERLAVTFNRTTKLILDPVVNEYVNRVAQKIVRFSDADVPFTVRVIDSGDIPRAYGLPGGYLYVDSALIISADDEAELAAVMAHEIAHVAARHATKALTRRNLFDIVGSMAMIAGPAGMGAANAGSVAGPLSVKKFSRNAEYEADLLGIEYAYAAGYDPEALLNALEKLHAIEVRRNAELAKIPGYHLASHVPFHHQLARGLANYPLTEERIQRLESEITEFLPDRKDYILDTQEFQEIKARLLASQTPILRRHPHGDENKGPVLRRTADSDFDSSLPSSVGDVPSRLSAGFTGR